MNTGGWIRIEDFCKKYSQRQNTIQKRVHDGSWERGVIYSCPDGGQGYVHEERAKAWLRARRKLPEQM